MMIQHTKTVALTAALTTLLSTTAFAGGLDRSGQSIGAIFEDGNHVEFSYGSVSPSVSGNAVAALGGFSSGDMSPSYNQVGFAVKMAVNDKFDIALIMDEPFGGDVEYATGTNYFAQGATATLDSQALTAIVKYNINDNFSVYGGVRRQTIESSVANPVVASYTLSGASTDGTGMLYGVAYERPDIALRVSLTQNMEIDHTQSVTETSAVAPGGVTSDTTFSSPKSTNLEFQTGIAADTLLFGSVRRVNWSSFDFAPSHYGTTLGRGSLLSYDDDTTTYSLGLGRRFNDNLSGAVTLGYEGGTGGYSGNLGPTDGFRSLGLGLTYTMGDMKITGGVRYVDVGDADIEHPTTPNTTGAEFRDNSATAFGIKIAYSF